MTMSDPNLKICDTDELRQEGLMGDEIDKYDGAFFEFGYPQTLKFWGLNLKEDLKIFFISADGYIVDQRTIEAGDLTLVESNEKCKYALELKMNADDKLTEDAMKSLGLI